MTKFEKKNICIYCERPRKQPWVYYIWDKSQYKRPAGRPVVVTLLKSLYLWNRMTNSLVVLFVRRHHLINFVFGRHNTRRCLPWHVERAESEWEGVGDTLPLVTPRRLPRLGFKFGVCLETGGYYFYTSQMWYVFARAHVHTPFPYFANGCTDSVQNWCVARDTLDKSFTLVRDGKDCAHCTCLQVGSRREGFTWNENHYQNERTYTWNENHYKNERT